MKVLQLCNKPPYPAVDGGCIAMKSISKGLLSQEIDLKIITISTAKHLFNISSFPKEFIKKTNIEGVFIDTKINIIDAFSALVTSDNYNVSRFFSADFDIKLKKVLEAGDYDYVHLESLFLTPYINCIKKYSKAKIVLRSHNLEHLIWERLTKYERNTAKKIYLKHLAKNLKKYELSILNDVDGIAAISFEDTSRYKNLNCKIPITTIPFGINIKDYVLKATPKTPKLKLFHIGSMDWSPNIEAINWFLNDIMPLIDVNNVELHLAGKNMPNRFNNLEKHGVINHGRVESANEFMSSNDVMIVPLMSGSGMRIKIIEGMALGKTIITTSIGLEGINATHNENIFIANTPNEYKNIILDLLNNPQKIIEIGIKARLFIEQFHDNTKLSSNLTSFYKSL